MKKQIMWAVLVLALLVIAGSGWVLNAVQSRNNARATELMELNTSFVQQYGSENTMKQLVSVEKVYAAYWTDKDGIPHVSWNIGGIWVTVYVGTAPETAP